MASAQVKAPSASEWLKQADRFLPQEETAVLKRKLADAAKQREERAKRELERAARDRAELEELLGESQRHDEADDDDHEEDDEHDIASSNSEPDFASMSAKKLVAYYAHKNPGATAGDFVNFVAQKRPELAPKGVHSELFRATRPGKTLRTKGAKPNTRYYPANHPEVADQRG